MAAGTSAAPYRVVGADFLAAARSHDALPPPAFAEIAFAGRSNVGKSSLINRLTGRRKLVRTSSTPGCTRGIGLFRLRLRRDGADDARLDLVDLPGYGYAKRSKVERASWGPMVEGFLRARAGLRAVVVIVDARRGLTADDEGLVALLEELGLGVVLAATKIDKVGASKRRAVLAKLGRSAGARVFGVSSLTGEGTDALWRHLLGVAAIGGAGASPPP